MFRFLEGTPLGLFKDLAAGAIQGEVAMWRERITQARTLAVWPFEMNQPHNLALWKKSLRMAGQALRGRNFRDLIRMANVVKSVRREVALGRMPDFRRRGP